MLRALKSSEPRRSSSGSQRLLRASRPIAPTKRRRTTSWALNSRPRRPRNAPSLAARALRLERYRTPGPPSQ
eukprot:14271555-Alexandrium_andersonii.AAC.1